MSVNQESRQTHFESSISPDEAKKLRSINYGLNQYVNLKDGDKVKWEFDPKSIEEGHKNNFGQERTRFKIYDPLLEHEFIYDAPASAARKIMPLIVQGYLFLRIERTGAGADDTVYTVEPVE